MDQPLLIVLTAFVIIAAIAMVFQAAMLFGVAKSARATEERIAQLAPKIAQLTPKLEALADTSRVAIEEGRASIAEITARTREILETTQRQLTRVDHILEDATDRVRVQFDRAEAVVDDAVNRAQQTVTVVHTGIMKPIREINGVAAGVRAAIHYFMRGGRPSPDQVTADEEMFI